MHLSWAGEGSILCHTRNKQSAQLDSGLGAVRWLDRWLDDGPVCCDGGEGSVDPAADEAQLSLGAGGIHVEGEAWGVACVQCAAPVCCKHHRLHVMVILPRHLDDGFTIIELHLHGWAISVTNGRGPDEAIAELDAEGLRQRMNVFFFLFYVTV